MPRHLSEQQAGAPEGVSFVTLASGTIEVLSPGTANLVLGRIRFAPGATLPFDPTDPSVDLLFVSSGTLTFRVEAPMKVARGVERRHAGPDRAGGDSGQYRVHAE